MPVNDLSVTGAVRIPFGASGIADVDAFPQRMVDVVVVNADISHHKACTSPAFRQRTNRVGLGHNSCETRLGYFKVIQFNVCTQVGNVNALGPIL